MDGLIKGTPFNRTYLKIKAGWYMKIFITVTALFFSIVIISSDASARGFSAGLLGSYAVDGGALEKTLENHAEWLEDNSTHFNYEQLQIMGVTLFTRYDFNNNIFLRTGLDYNFKLYGGITEEGDASSMTKYKFDYEAFTIPLYCGITLSPDRGRTSVYGAAGFYLSVVSIGRDFSKGDITAEGNRDIFVSGITALTGI